MEVEVEFVKSRKNKMTDAGRAGGSLLVWGAQRDTP
jgi:hypothetical protein